MNKLEKKENIEDLYFSYHAIHEPENSALKLIKTIL